MVDLVAARSGMRILDLGSGLGIPSLALTKVVGSTGTVVAVDRSLRVLVALRDSAAKETGEGVVVPICQDLDSLSSQQFKAGVYDRVTAVLPETDVLIIQYGLNDANRRESDLGVPRVTSASYRANLEEIVYRACAREVTHILLVTNHLPAMETGP